MAYEPKDLRGALFRNASKVEGSNSPDYNGNILINGTKYKLAAWLKDSAKGKFLSIAATEVKPEQQTAKPKQAAMADNEIPF